MENRTEKDIADYTDKASAVIEALFGKKPEKIDYKTTGLTNYVFEVKVPDGEFIIRISTSPEKIKNFFKEQWVIDRVRKEGVPVAEIIKVGSDIIDAPYMVQKKLDGQVALYHPEKKKILQKMGEYTCLINSIATTGYGNVFDWSSERLSKNFTWAAFLKNEIKLNDRIQILERNKMMSTDALEKLRDNLERIEDLNLPTVLNHGDMRRKNVLVDEKGTINAIIDWEESCSNIAPYWDFSIALHDLSIDDKQFFLEGYGIEPKEYAKIYETIISFNLINYAPIIDELAKKNDEINLEYYRLRLSGYLDLYTFA